MIRYEGAVYRPPSEAYSLIIQVTLGCARNTCTFCSMYKDKPFRMRSLEDIEEDLRRGRMMYPRGVRRLFLADGDALVLKTETLLEILALCHRYFPEAERITAYGAPADVLQKAHEELVQLKQAGLDMIYMGGESGDDGVLKAVKKGATADELIAAGKKLKEAGIQVSVTFISGLGGKARMVEHAVGSARVVTEMAPDYVGFLTLMVEPDCELYQEVAEGRFELLDPKQVVDEMLTFLDHVYSPETVFRSNHASNYVNLAGNLGREDIDRMQKQLIDAAHRERFKPEYWRGF